jgi:heme/copper-type cytochrome/quinol oxidase subunit 2
MSARQKANKVEMMIRSNCARRATLLCLTAAALGLVLQTTPARAESGWSLLNMTQGVTEMSRRIYDLHMLIFWICVIIGVVVFGAMFWSIIFYADPRARWPIPRSFTTPAWKSSGPPCRSSF